MSNTTATLAVTPLTEYDAVKTAMQRYIDGVLEGRSEKMRPSFHPAASFFGHYDGTLLAGSVQALFDWVDANGPATGTRTHFAQIDIRETTALVRLEMDAVSGKLSLGGNARLSDFFTLLKIDGEWRITHKTFHWY
jgi:putative lumazine-binding protein